ncbi:hypothetical protein SAMN05443575_0355 [Jatrophihabitans endophyticus]|uniref:MmyB-like transcription regulator ligand binding domain-containing protein n=1 Tax=Jatrophihabitans endophyticus TaxID=1206085 RepID=A0A1M5CU75_9ACTN|nr:hypothetical protein [Jatrophihabitans endophyticus]SHF58285.1 hypothetical protein SAMN05443575_0355 [Jatrophihabitans endophyticus]
MPPGSPTSSSSCGGAVGTVRLQYETFAVAGGEGHVLYVYFATAGSDDEATLRALAAAPPAARPG